MTALTSIYEYITIWLCIKFKKKTKTQRNVLTIVRRRRDVLRALNCNLKYVLFLLSNKSKAYTNFTVSIFYIYIFDDMSSFWMGSGVRVGGVWFFLSGIIIVLNMYMYNDNEIFDTNEHIDFTSRHFAISTSFFDRFGYALWCGDFDDTLAIFHSTYFICTSLTRVYFDAFRPPPLWRVQQLPWRQQLALQRARPFERLHWIR